MKIIFIIPSLSTGGAELQTINHVNYLFENGHDVELVVLSDQLENVNGLNIPPERLHLLEQKNLKPLGFKFLLKIPSLLPKLLKILKKSKVYHVIAVLPASHFIMRIVKFFRPRLLIHAYYRDVYYALYPMDKGLKKLFNQCNKRLAKGMDNSSLFISKAVYNDIRNNFHILNPLILPNSLVPKEISNERGQHLVKEKGITSDYLILLPGRLHFKKGHALFLEAIERFVADKKPKDVHVLFAGDGPEREELKEMVISKKLNSFITFLGNVENELLLSLHKCVNLVVIPSHFEGFGNVAIEGLRQGSTMLVSNADGLAEIIRDGENGYVFEKGNEEELLKKLKFLYKHKGKELLKEVELKEEFEEKYTVKSQMHTVLKHISKLQGKSRK